MKSTRILLTVLTAFILSLASCAAPAAPPAPTETPTALLPTAPRPTSETSTPKPALPAPTQTSVSTSAPMPNPGGYAWKLVTAGLLQPTSITGANDGTGRLFIVEQPGLIRFIQSGQSLPQSFLDISNRVGSNGAEQGLLGLAFHPQFTQNGYFFVNYTDPSGNTHISRFTASGNAADRASEKQLLFIKQPFANHNGGALAFGPDGYLYIGLGDGGSAGDPYGNGQANNTLLGKIIRIDVDHGDPYAIPPGNPFAISGTGQKEIWALGLQNPWRFAFDRATGGLWIGDVGQDKWEEVDYVPTGAPSGLNFGWNSLEGTHPYKGTNQPGFTAPVAEYAHGPGCSVTGGVVYRGSSLPEWQGVYLFGDYCSGFIWGLESPPNGSAPAELFSTGFRISSFGQDDAGEVYVTDYATGNLYRLGEK